MGIDTQTLLLDPIYDSLGIDAVLDQGTAGTVDLVILDETQGVMLESQAGGLQFGTQTPAACVRMSELTANGLTRESITGLVISFNGNDWKIVRTRPKPTQNSAGEVYLILQDV
jgi:hypothetical protein